MSLPRIITAIRWNEPIISHTGVMYDMCRLLLLVYLLPRILLLVYLWYVYMPLPRIISLDSCRLWVSFTIFFFFSYLEKKYCTS